MINDSVIPKMNGVRGRGLGREGSLSGTQRLHFSMWKFLWEVAFPGFVPSSSVIDALQTTESSHRGGGFSLCLRNQHRELTSFHPVLFLNNCCPHPTLRLALPPSRAFCFILDSPAPFSSHRWAGTDWNRISVVACQLDLSPSRDMVEHWEGFGRQLLRETLL